MPPRQDPQRSNPESGRSATRDLTAPARQALAAFPQSVYPNVQWNRLTTLHHINIAPT
jgi:hypothetical protein